MLLSVTLRHLPAATIPRTQVVGKVRFEKDLTLAGLGSRNIAGLHLLAKRLGMEFQKVSGLSQIKCFHPSPPWLRAR
jgi:hypothetical protein